MPSSVQKIFDMFAGIHTLAYKVLIGCHNTMRAAYLSEELKERIAGNFAPNFQNSHIHVLLLLVIGQFVTSHSEEDSTMLHESNTVHDVTTSQTCPATSESPVWPAWKGTSQAIPGSSTPSTSLSPAQSPQDQEYSPAEREFMQAMHEYKRQSGRMFPTWSEVLEVLRDLGYQKTHTYNNSPIEQSAD